MFKVFDQAMELVAKRYWGEAEFNGSSITVKYKPCLDQETPYYDYAVVHKVKLLTDVLMTSERSYVCKNKKFNLVS